MYRRQFTIHSLWLFIPVYGLHYHNNTKIIHFHDRNQLKPHKTTIPDTLFGHSEKTP